MQITRYTLAFCIIRSIIYIYILISKLDIIRVSFVTQVVFEMKRLEMLKHWSKELNSFLYFI